MIYMIHHENILTDSKNRFIMKSYFSSAHIRKNQFCIHHHAQCELSAIIAGSGIYHCRQGKYEINPGDVFLFSGDEEHCITDIFTPCEILNIHFVPSLLWTDNDLSLSRIFFARNENFQNKMNPENPMTKILFNDVIAIEKELSEKSDGYKSMAKYLLLSAITNIVRNYDYIDRSVDYNAYNNKIKPMEKALKYIEENLTKKITLESIAAVANMTPTYFSSIFKKLNGISLWEYITAKRIDKAIVLLRTTDRNKLDIAMECGFNSSSNFYKAFWSVTGKKPGEYK